MAMAANKTRCRLIRAQLQSRGIAKMNVLETLTYGLKGATSTPQTTTAVIMRSASQFRNCLHRMRMYTYI